MNETEQDECRLLSLARQSLIHDVLLRNTMINEWCYRDDDRYTMKASAYSPFSTLWKNNWRVFHAMDPAAAGPRYGKPEGTPSPARSSTPIYERETPRHAL